MELPILQWLIESLGVVFADDTDLYTYALELKGSISVSEEMQSSLYYWCDLINSTGGATKAENTTGILLTVNM